MLNSLFSTFFSFSRLILPWFALGLIIAALVEKSLKPKHIKKYFHTLTYPKIFAAQLMGMISPLSIMSFIPIASELVKKGVSPGLLFSFFIAERAYDLQAFFIISTLFGIKIAIFNAFSIFISLIITAIYLKQQNLKIKTTKKRIQAPFWKRQVKLFSIILSGIFIASILRNIIPESLVHQYAGTNLSGTISAIILGFSFYFGPILNNYPVARSFMDLGMVKMGILTFLTLSPIFNFVIILILGGMVSIKKAIPPILIYTITGITISIILGFLL